MTVEEYSNLNNLTALWRAMGAGALEEAEGSFACLEWPNRSWIEPSALRGRRRACEEFVVALGNLPNPVVPLLVPHRELESRLEEAGMREAISLTAMHARPGAEGTAPNVSLQEADTPSKMVEWTQVASGAFGYQVDLKVVERLSRAQAGIYLAQCEGRSIGSLLLFATEQTVGVHMVGVLPRHRRRGYAREIMAHAMVHARRARAEHIVLQAAPKAQALYESLGFRPLFGIPHYTRG